MNTLLFISRVAFICNFCMLLSWSMQYISFFKDIDLQSTLIIAGFLLAVVFNLISLIWVGFVLIKAKQRKELKMAWLFVFNFLCLIFQLYFIQK